MMQHVRDVTDPEHPYTLEQLKVVSEDAITVKDKEGIVRCAQLELCAILNNICQNILLEHVRALGSVSVGDLASRSEDCAFLVLAVCNSHRQCSTVAWRRSLALAFL